VATKTRKRAVSPKASAPTQEPITIVVRRGALKRFESLKRATADLPVELTWDRRLGERRRTTGDPAHERRRAERRRQPQFTWDLADFVVVAPGGGDGAEIAPEAAAKKKR